MSKEAINLALEKIADALPAYIDGVVAREYLTVIHKALAEQPAPVQQEPVAFLANGTRFKISYDNRQSGGQIHGIPPELGGRWVAFVAADDDCHLKLTSPPAQRKPLTDEQIKAIHNELCGTVGSDYKTISRAIEAAHGIGEKK